jgi:hypothetical protein
MAGRDRRSQASFLALGPPFTDSSLLEAAVQQRYNVLATCPLRARLDGKQGGTAGSHGERDQCAELRFRRSRKIGMRLCKQDVRSLKCSASSLPPWPLRRRMRVWQRSSDETSVDGENQAVQVRLGPARQSDECLFQPLAWPISAALGAHARGCDPVDGAGDDRLRPSQQCRGHLTRPHVGVFQCDHRGHGPATEAGDIVDRGSVGSAHRSSCADRRRAPTRHGPF